ncbi:MAG: alanine--tRNA ligase [Candidatus Eisenbacteria bacterium]|uniref:Alanine--tRNA ligase n=1 Tax=Eiseniibacteriota bacterium TaxID=2212470 RepID=A0A933W9K8_UNCEI|nr:alanine--tRNA ligase [Candidatus Eisenbacteria bacterium]
MSNATLKTGADLRRAFLDFFVRNGHTEVPSSPLVPHGDPTLMFTTAGMVQFKPYYSATGDVPYTRATSVQKCLRLTDLDNVGLTPRHDTFFEMLGNFSFGPKAKGAYFKEEATALAWEFVTKTLGLPKERLFVSIFGGEPGVPRDDEAAALWVKLGLSPDHLVALGRKDNFWGPAGGAGACGPCSEIYFDLGEKRPDYLPDGAFWGESAGDAGDRFMEFWNLVFPQFDAQPDGKLDLLPNPGIDTGMGIERLALILQGKNTIFETDLFAPLVDAVMGHAKKISDPKSAVRDARIIADHVRALSFAISEGALPGNEGAGYVLRRLLRRAVTRGRSRQGLGLTEAFLPRVAEQAIAQFGGHYKELAQNRDRILRVLEQEETGFGQTYEAGNSRLEELLSGGAKGIAGADAFLLHDTYGFPIELTEEIAASRGVAVDKDGFEKAMDEQRARARAASKFAKDGDEKRAPWTVVSTDADSRFLGYEKLAEDGVVVRRWRERGDQLEVVLDRTPCYAESGGQVSDRGSLRGNGVVAELTAVYKEDDAIVHRVKFATGDRAALLAASASSQLSALVDPAHRAPTNRHHTATHLLHAALRHTLGTHVHQAGSMVAPDRLRFDYAHFESPSDTQLAAIESRVNAWVLANREVSWRVMPIDEAKAQGAMALFGEKYGAEVRMVTVDGVGDAGIEPSRELCGGTHVARTGDIGTFVLTGESAIASGVRRVEALCGTEALAYLRGQQALLQQAASVLQSAVDQVPAQIEKLKSEVTALKKAQAEAGKAMLETTFRKLGESAASAPGGRWIVAELPQGTDPVAAREAANVLRDALGTGAAVVSIQGDGKLTFLAVVSDDLVAAKKLRADELVREVAKVTGGSGGGKPNLALAGGKDASKLSEALDEARKRLVAGLGA